MFINDDAKFKENGGIIEYLIAKAETYTFFSLILIHLFEALWIKVE